MDDQTRIKIANLTSNLKQSSTALMNQKALNRLLVHKIKKMRDQLDDLIQHQAAKNLFANRGRIK